MVVIARTTDQLAPIGLTKIISVRQGGRLQASGRELRSLGETYKSGDEGDKGITGGMQHQGGEEGIRQWIGWMKSREDERKAKRSRDKRRLG